MSAKHIIGSLLLLAPVALAAQEAKKPETTGEFTVEGRSIDLDPTSSKYNEYTDRNNTSPLFKLGFEVLTPKGMFFDLRGRNLLRDDQSLRLSTGKFGHWSLVAEQSGTPHNLSFKAMTPYTNQGSGLFTLDSTSPIPNRNLAPSASQAAAGVLRDNDTATAAWLTGILRPTELGTQRDKIGATLTLTPTERLKLRMSFSDERKDGSRISYGPIGDRPPRTLNIQLAQPIDFKSKELRLEAEYNKPRYQAMVSYTVSKFENGIDTFRWQNPYAVYTGSNSYDQWSGHRVATFGQMALSPDNTYQNFMLSLGVNLPWSSRLNVSAAYGKMEQDQTLLPYSTSAFNSTTVDFTSTAVLPRQTAEAEITTKRINIEYSVNPLSRLSLRGYVRYYDLDNGTPQDAWWGITSDTMPGNATATVTNPTYKNQRLNLAYSFTQTITGLEASTYLPFWYTSLGLNLEQESMDRTFREGRSSDETLVKASFRTRPARWLSLRGKVLLGDRDGGSYDYTVTRGSYWYDPAGRDRDNPGVTFSNHPDMRKYDVSDRKRTEVDLSAVLTPMDGLDVVFSASDRKHDYDSGVTPVQPLLNNPYAATPADQQVYTAGNQVGLLENNSMRLAMDVSYAATERLSLNAFISRDRINLSQRGMEFDENHKLDPIGYVPGGDGELGPWTRAASQWMANTEDETDSYGLGVAYELIPGKLRAAADYTYSNGTVNIAYSGFGTQSSVNPANTLPDVHQYGFRTPSTAINTQRTLNASLNYQFSKHLAVSLHYAYDRYHLEDWMQEANTPWFESVAGNEHLLRDTTAMTSTQWGNRLVSLGSYLAPTYDAHHISLAVNYRF